MIASCRSCHNAVRWRLISSCIDSVSYTHLKMDLDIQVSKLKLMRANHTSQIYSLESDIARRYPAEITAAKERIAGLKADLAVAKPLLEQDLSLIHISFPA